MLAMRRTAIKASMRVVAGTVSARTSKTQVITSREWTRDEINMLCRKYRTQTAGEIAAVLQRSVPSVRAKIRALGLTKSRLTRTAPATATRSARPSTSHRRPSWKKTPGQKRPSKRNRARRKVVHKAAHHPQPVLRRPAHKHR